MMLITLLAWMISLSVAFHYQVRTSAFGSSRQNDVGLQPSGLRLSLQSVPRDSSLALTSDRREVIASMSSTSTVIAANILFAPSLTVANAEDGVFRREGKGYGYVISVPTGFQDGKKPLQTHLDEVNFKLEGARGYEYGITVDPVRINSLREFGKPEEVAARVVTAEVNRDGIFEVLLSKDPTEDGDTGAYAIDYVSDGKRGKKQFLTRIFISDFKLYVLTVRVKAEEYAEREKEILECVRTFKPL